MEISEVKVFPVREEKLKAFVSIVFDRCFMVNDIKIINGRDGLFISMPSRKKKNGDYKDVAHPLNNETRGRIQGRILDEYRQVVGEEAVEPAARPAPAAKPAPVTPAEPTPEPVTAPEPKPEPKPEPAPEPELAPEPAATAEPAAEVEERTPTAVPPLTSEDGREAERNEEKTLDEVTEKFSSESFWTA